MFSTASSEGIFQCGSGIDHIPCILQDVVSGHSEEFVVSN